MDLTFPTMISLGMLQINLRKFIETGSVVSVTNFECLGYLVDGNVFRPDPKWLSSLVDSPPPENL